MYLLYEISCIRSSFCIPSLMMESKPLSFVATLTPTLFLTFQFAWKADKGVHPFPTISNIYKYKYKYILHNTLTIYKYYFVTYFFYYVSHYVGRKWKGQVDTLIDFFVLRRVRVHTKKLEKKYFFHRFHTGFKLSFRYSLFNFSNIPSILYFH